MPRKGSIFEEVDRELGRKRRTFGNWALGGVVLYALFWLVVIVGYVWNIIKIVGGISDPITTMFILRVVGAFAAPLGVILGYL